MCQISNVLFNVNFKTCTTNWKGYLNLLSKHYEGIKNIVDIKVPIDLLISELEDNFKYIEELVRFQIYL